MLTSLHDSCRSQMNKFLSLHSIALTRMSFRDFPSRYEMMGSPERFLSDAVDYIRKLPFPHECDL